MKIGHRIYSTFFSCLSDKQRDPSKKEHAEHILTILFDRTLHNGYFAKLPFGSRDKFAKMTNTTLVLVVLTLLHQLQKYFYKIGDANENKDWNVHGKFCPIKAKHVSREFPLDNMYIIKANSTAVTKITSVQWITPDNKNSKQVVKSLEEWAAKILCGDNNYVQNIANLLNFGLSPKISQDLEDWSPDLFNLFFLSRQQTTGSFKKRTR